MKEIPILLSTPMVHAIMDGRKTMTRRIVKGIALDWLKPDMFTPEFVASPENGLCPYGQPGDLLWVRESFYEPLFEKLNGKYYYKADLEKQSWDFKWKPSIHMPKAAARIWLRVTDVRVERLQDISEDDAIAEGIEHLRAGAFGKVWRNYGPIDADVPYYFNPKHSFQSLWESINGPESWNKNPWVWVVSFEVVSKTGKPC